VKRLALLVAAAVGGMFWLGVGAAPAFADNGPHVPTAGNLTVDRCASCHRAHTGKAEFLLKQTQPALCYTCHGSDAGGATTDVKDGLGYVGFERGDTVAGALRGGGFEFALIGSGNASRTDVKTVPVLSAGQATTSSHTVDGSDGIAWGNGDISTDPANVGKTIQLRCGSCHDPHGNGNYRILRGQPEQAFPDLAHGAPNPYPFVDIPDSTIKAYTTTNYWATDDPYSPPAQVVYGTTTYTTTEFIKNIAAWCSQCHTRYLAPHGSYETDSGDATFMYRHRTDQNYREGGANCITCHVAHGTNASMSGTQSSQATNPDGSGPLGSSRLLRVDNRGTCNMCHSV
jgi:predicted CXXCH cytochrome family protein